MIIYLKFYLHLNFKLYALIDKKEELSAKATIVQVVKVENVPEEKALYLLSPFSVLSTLPRSKNDIGETTVFLNEGSNLITYIFNEVYKRSLKVQHKIPHINQFNQVLKLYQNVACSNTRT